MQGQESADYSNIGINNKVKVIFSFKKFLSKRKLLAEEINSCLIVWKMMHLVKFSSAQHYRTGSLTRPGTGNFVRLHCQPVVTGGPLLLELSIKHAGHVPQSEGTDSRAAD